MSVTIDDYRYKLLKDIAGSASQQETKRFIDVAMMDLDEHKISVTQVSQFIDLMIHDLGYRDQTDNSKRQSGNIRIARIHLNEIKLNRKFGGGSPGEN